MVVVGYTGDTVQDDKRLIVLNVIPEDPPRESLSGRRRREGETVTHQVQAGSLGSVMCGAEPVEQILGNDSNNIILHS